MDEAEELHLVLSYVIRMCRRPGSSRSVCLTRLKSIYNKQRSSMGQDLLNDLEGHESVDVAGLDPCFFLYYHSFKMFLNVPRTSIPSRP